MNDSTGASAPLSNLPGGRIARATPALEGLPALGVTLIWAFLAVFLVYPLLRIFYDAFSDEAGRLTQQLAPSGVDLVTEAVLEFDEGTAEIRAGISEPPHQWLVIAGERGEIELRDAAYTSWRDDETVLLVSDGTSTERRVVPATDPYRVMVEEVSAAVGGGTGWLLPLSESLATASVLDAAFASAAAGGAPVSVDAIRG